MLQCKVMQHKHTSGTVQYWHWIQKWYSHIFLVMMVAGILITQTQKLMIESSSLDKDTCNQTGKPSTRPFTLFWTYYHYFHSLLTAFAVSPNCRDLCDDSCFIIIDHASTSFRLKLKEALHITWLKSVLNKQKNHVSITISVECKLFPFTAF